MTKQKVPITYVSDARTRKDIKVCFEKWGISDYSIGGEAGSKVKPLAFVRFSVNGQEQTIRCERAWEYGANLRAIYRLLESLRMAAHYGIMEELATAAAAMLPAGKPKRPPHEVLGIAKEADPEIAEAVHRALARKHHPDVGGTNEKMQEINDALAEFKAVRAKAEAS